jgi:DNA-binding MarR family transcriptional regulator
LSRQSPAGRGERRSRAQLEQELGYEARSWQLDQDLFDDVLAQLAGLNRTDMRCLDIVGRDGPISAGDLAASARLTSGAVTAVLDRLEARGLVRRTRDSEDRRRVLVETTPEMERQSAEAFAEFLADAQRDSDTFTDEQLGVILDFMRRNRALLQRHTARLHDELAKRDGVAAQ